MCDARAVWARRFVDRIAMRRSDLYWPTETLGEVEPIRVASVVDAWWEMLGLPLLARRDDDRGAA